jgi:hypothetical protein
MNYGKRRMLLTSTILLLAVVCSGCSFHISFKLKNLSGKTIAVNYTVKNIQDGFAPSLLKKTETDGAQSVPIPDDRIRLDIENGSVEFTMFADEIVELDHTIDLRESEYEQAFNLKSLRIAADDGAISLEGLEAFKSFRPIRKRWYTFGPEIVGFEFEYR